MMLMMGRALLIVGWIATIGFVATGILGYTIQPAEATGLHLLLGVAACLLLLFSHCWILFYLIGTGKAIKDAVAEHGMEQEIVEQTKVFKSRSSPWLMLAMLLAMATFIIGGGVHTGAVPAWIHQGLFLAAVVVQVWTLLVEQRVLTANDRLMTDLERRLRSL